MQQPDYSISTPENVDLHLELAGIGNRVLAGLIDTIITYAVCLAIGMLVWAVVSTMQLMEVAENVRSIALAVLLMGLCFFSFFIVFGYYILFEGIWQGQTPGKKIAGIRVIELNGQPVGWVGVIIRNLIRTFDMGLAFVGLLPMLFDKRERRFGDYAANTIVIRERKPEVGSNIVLHDAAVTDLLDVGRISPQEYELVVSFLKRRETMSKSQRPVVAAELASFLRDKLSDADAEPLNEKFLEQVYATYKARAE